MRVVFRKISHYRSNMSRLGRRVQSERVRLWLETEISHRDSGDRLPTDHDIARRLEVSESTVRRVMTTLREAGTVERVAGSGTYVARRLPVADGTPSTESSMEIVAKHFWTMICEGAIKQGERLPPVKSAAMTLRVAPSTVIAAFRSLCTRGYVQKVGKAYWVIPLPDARVISSNKSIVAFHPESRDFGYLYTHHEFSRLYWKMERELIRFGYSITYAPASSFGAYLREWEESGLYPHGLIFADVFVPDYEQIRARLERLTRISRPRSPNVLVVAADVLRPLPGTRFVHEGNIHTSVYRALAQFSHLKRFARVHVFFDLTASSMREFRAVLKLRAELRRLAPHCRFRVIVKPSAGLLDPYSFYTAAFGCARPDTRIQTASKYENVRLDELSPDIVLTSQLSSRFVDHRRGDLWVFAQDEHAISALRWAARSRVPIPDELSVVGLEHDPQYLQFGLSGCIPDWDVCGYLMAHAIIADFPVRRTSKGYVKMATLVLERATTP